MIAFEMLAGFTSKIALPSTAFAFVQSITDNVIIVFWIYFKKKIIAQQVNAPNIPKSDTKWAPTADHFVLSDTPITLIAQDRMIKSLKNVSD